MEPSQTIVDLQTKNFETATKEIEDLKVRVDRKHQKILRLKESEMDLKEKLRKSEDDKKELLHAKDRQILELQGHLLDFVNKTLQRYGERLTKLETENLELKARLAGDIKEPKKKMSHRPIKLGELSAELLANARSHVEIKDFEVPREILEAML